MVAKPRDGVIDRFHLKRPWLLYGALGVAFLNLNAKVLAEVDLSDLGVSVADRPFCIWPPAASCYDPANAKDVLLRAAKKLVDLAFSECVVIRVALALDRD